MRYIQDRFNRVIDYIRISITDQCNLRCIYCMPTRGVRRWNAKDILSFEELTRFIRIAAGLGIRKVRITGGEPLTRRDLPSFIETIRMINGIEDVSLTTNGVLLRKQARALASAGLMRVNVSLDSLNPGKYSDITRGGDIQNVFDGIQEAAAAGLSPVKINMVPIRGINDDEIEDFADMTKCTSYNVRFIEFMPVGKGKIWGMDKFVPTTEVKQRVSSIAPIYPVRVRKCGPARYYRFKGAPGVIGFISALTDHFCNSCNRMRLTSNGKLRPCLFSNYEVDIKSALRRGLPDSEIARLITTAVNVKQEGHALHFKESYSDVKHMSRIGG